MQFPDLSKITVNLDQESEEKIIPVSNFIFEVIASNDIDDLNELIDDISNFPYKILLRLCQNNPKIENFLRTNEGLTKKLSDKLHAAGHPEIEIKSMDGKMMYSVFDLYLGASFMTDFINQASDISRIDALNYACELGLNDALLSRCMVNEKIVKQNNQSKDRIQNAIDMIMQDANQLSNLYWGLGYLEAGFILHSLGTALLNQSENNNYAHTLIEQATKKFLCASFIKDQPYSNEVMHHVTKGKGTDFLFTNTQLELASWDVVKTALKTWTQNRYEVLEGQAIDELGALAAG